MKTLKQLLLLPIALVPSVLLSWAVWFPLRQWAFSLIPAGQWAGLTKLAIAVLLVYGGGVALPLMLALLGFALWAKLIS